MYYILSYDDDNDNDITVVGWVLNHRRVDGFGLYHYFYSVAFDISILIFLPQVLYFFPKIEDLYEAPNVLIPVFSHD